MIVMKFGGTSMANAESWNQILDIVLTRKNPVLIVSATSGTTNLLLQAADLALVGKVNLALEKAEEIKLRHIEILIAFGKDAAHPLFIQGKLHIETIVNELCGYLTGISTLRELTPRSLDRISSVGERLSSYLLYVCAQMRGISSEWVDAADILKTDAQFGKANPDRRALEKSVGSLNRLVSNNVLPVMGGFYGSEPGGEITTLGRGGSDYSAALIGYALRAKSIEIWTDVSGMYTCDPRMIPEAISIPEITFDEAAELAFFGAKVLHPATIQPAIEVNIPVWVKNTFDPEHPGTRISKDAEGGGTVRAISFKKGITVITISSSRMLMAYGFLARVFAIFEKHKVAVDIVTTSEVSISMTISSLDNHPELFNELRSVGNVQVHENQSVICLVGRQFLKENAIAGRIFSSLKEIIVRMISQGSSENNLSLVVSENEMPQAVKNLHKEFFGN